MSKWLKEGVPVDRGCWKGCLRIRWRPARGAPEVTGYLPGDQPALKGAYDDYEARSWAESEIPDAPEIYFREHLNRFLSQQTGKDDVVQQELEQRSAAKMTLREWVGRKNGDGEAEQGPFWDCTPAKGDQRTTDYWRVLRRLGPLADRPMASLRFSDFQGWFEERMACSACTERAIESGKTPGTDISWSRLVPRYDRVEFDGADSCADHYTALVLSTFESYQGILNAMFKAALGPRAFAQFGVPLVQYNPVPSSEDLFDKRTVRFLESDGEELRYGLSEAQVQLQTEASPPLFRAIPFAAAFTLNRGGQELGGMSIGDFSWIETDAGKVGKIELRNFYRMRKGGGRVMSSHGKTLSSARTVLIPAFVAQLIEDHIIQFRSTPNPSACSACCEGVWHWGGPLRHNHNCNPHVGCDFAADAPLWVDARGKRLDPRWYVSKVWHPMCAQAGLTAATLGWKPQLKHSRSTGTMLHLNHGTDRAEVVRLGGWSSEQMIADHYERLSLEQRARFVSRWSGDDGGVGIEFENRRLRREVERLRIKLVAAGFDPDGELEPIVVVERWVPSEQPTRFTMDEVAAAVVAAAVERCTPRVVLDKLGVAVAQSNYRRLATACAALGIPEMPSTGRQLPDGRHPSQLEEWWALVSAWEGTRKAS